jgi:hypothetical protein
LAFGIAFYLDWKVAFVVLATYPFMVGAFIGEVNMSYFIIFYSILEKQDEFLE